MGWIKSLLGRSGQDETDYDEEARALVNEGRFRDALTSFNLALKESPGDPIILQEIAMVYTRIGMSDEAAKTYRHVLRKHPDAAGAHYGLGFLLRRAGQKREAVDHLSTFLANPPKGPEYDQHISHARSTLATLKRELKQDSADADG
jgi:tetratricopeptide (TPR) repeat protein